MAFPNTLEAYTSADVTAGYPSPGQKGYMPGVTREAVKLITPTDNPFWQKLRKGDVMPDFTQRELTDALDAITGNIAGVAAGVEPGTLTSGNNRHFITNYLQKIEFTFSIAEEAEEFAKRGGIAGGITSEMLRDIQLKTRQMMKKIEFLQFTKQPGRQDNNQGTCGYEKGVYTMLTETNSYIGTDNQTTVNDTYTNVNMDLDANGAQVPFVPVVITDIKEAQVKNMILMCHNQGSSDELALYIPTILHQFYSDTFVGRPNTRVTVPEKDHALDMMFEYYTAVSGVKLELIPNRTMNQYCAAMIDHEQFAKRVFFPFQVRHYTDGRRNKEGYGQMSWTVTCGVKNASGGWYLPASFTANKLDTNGLV